MLFVSFGCSSDKNGTDSKPDGATVSSATDKTTLDTVDPELGKYNISAVVYNGFDKISDIRKSGIKNTRHNIYLAKNESEAVHVSFFSDSDNADVQLVTDGQYDGVTVISFVEHTVPCGDTAYPDPLVPFNGQPFSLNSSNETSFYIEFKTAKDTAAGEKTYKFRLESNGKKVSNEVTVTLKVWDFALPEAPATRTAMWIYPALAEFTDNYSDKTYVTYYEMLLDHGISAYDLPYDILDPRVDKYLSDPRVTSFRVPCKTTEDTVLLSYYEKLRSNPEWLKKAYFYPVDEPKTVAELNDLKSLRLRLLTLCPEIKLICPYYTNIDVTQDYDQTQFVLDVTDIPCPKPCMWNDETVYSEAQAKKWPSFKSRMDEHTRNGGELWWYVCNTPGKPYLNLFIDEPGLDHRVLFWQQYRYGATGFLYWCANYWKNTPDPWTDVDTKTLSYPVYGEGLLLYPGKKVGQSDPVASLRLKAIQNGIEDYGLLTLAEQMLGRDYVLRKITDVTPDVSKISVNSNGFSDLRAQIGNDIETHLKQNK